ncbi:ABC transporter permease [Bombiscardovia apis]|uniref:ABC transporter permease n=1 Tax=Bombiscardovia apis TaxID=2932182 RepID=A0ABM8BAT7_9BIFI|nr:hypothetical protein [Bombiscardovia apis]BDR54020.1 ABC transporter permease [Bombiscardovia apis]
MSQPTMPAAPVMGGNASAAAPTPVNNYQSSRRELSQHVHVGLWRSIRSEFVKLTSLKSTWILLIINLLLLPAGAAMAAWTMKTVARLDLTTGDFSNHTRAIPAQAVWQSVTTFVGISTIVVGIFGVLSITTEFTSSSVDASLTANPHRNMMLAAKAIVVAAFSWCFSQLGILLSWAIVRLQLSGVEILSLDHAYKALPWVSIIGAPLISVGFAVMAVGVGALCRSTVGAVFTLIGIDFFLPAIISIFSIAMRYVTWIGTLSKLMPTQLMSTFLAAGSSSGEDISAKSFDPLWWQAGLLFLVWVVAFYAIGAVLLEKRDIK